MGTDIEDRVSAHIIRYRYGITEIVKEFRKCSFELCRGRPILRHVNNPRSGMTDKVTSSTYNSPSGFHTSQTIQRTF
jgi:hypothetical protein